MIKISLLFLVEKLFMVSYTYIWLHNIDHVFYLLFFLARLMYYMARALANLLKKTRTSALVLSLLFFLRPASRMKRVEGYGERERVMYMLCYVCMYVRWLDIHFDRREFRSNSLPILKKKTDRRGSSWRHQQHSSVAYIYIHTLHGLIAPYITLRIMFDTIHKKKKALLRVLGNVSSRSSSRTQLEKESSWIFHNRTNKLRNRDDSP